MSSAIWGRWVVATSLGELAGFAIPGAVGAVAAAAGASPPVLAVLVVIAGAGEGYVLGAVQAPVLARAVPGVARRDWRRATAAGAVVAWALGMGMSFLWDLPGSPVLPIVAAVPLGLLALAALPALQWRVLREHLEGAGAWIPGSMGAWAIGVALSIAVVSVGVGPGTSIAAGIAVGLIAGLSMGVTVACLTGLVLVRLVARGGRGGE